VRELEARVEQALGYDAPALEQQLGVGSQGERADLCHPRRGGKSEADPAASRSARMNSAWGSGSGDA